MPIKPRPIRPVQHLPIDTIFVEGVAINQLTQQPLADVLVHRYAPSSKGVFTDSSGRFKLAIPIDEPTDSIRLMAISRKQIDNHSFEGSVILYPAQYNRPVTIPLMPLEKKVLVGGGLCVIRKPTLWQRAKNWLKSR